MSNVQVEIPTASLLIDKIDKIGEAGYFQNRIETIREDTEKYSGLPDTQSFS